MIKRLGLSVIGLVFAVLAPALAQEKPAMPENFDPLEERLKVEGAYIPNYRELMRDMVVALGQYAHDNRPDFHIVLDGGETLLTRTEWENDLDDLHRAELAGAKTDDERFLLKLFSPDAPVAAGTPNRRYIKAVSGLLVTNAVCSGGMGKLNKATEELIKEYGLFVMGVEHCADFVEREKAITELARKKIPVHADTDKVGSFDGIPKEKQLFGETPDIIDALAKIRNLLVLTNTRTYTDKDLWVEALENTNYDLLIVDPMFHNNVPLTKDEVNRLRTKKAGSRRMVFAVLNVGMAEDTRPYWEKGWKLRDPTWLRFPDKKNPAGIIVDYWNPVWKRIVGIYFRSIMDLGYDGVVLRGIDAHKTYERIIPIN